MLSTINAHEGGLNKYQTLLETSKSSYYTSELVDASIVMGKKDSNFKPNKNITFVLELAATIVPTIWWYRLSMR